MKTSNIPTALFNTSASNTTNGTISPQEIDSGPPRVPRRSFLRRLGLGAALLAPVAGLIGSASEAFGDHEHGHGGITEGDAALLRFAAAAEILEADLWIQYNELGGIQDPEVPGGTGNPAYTAAIAVLDA